MGLNPAYPHGPASPRRTAGWLIVRGVRAQLSEERPSEAALLEAIQRVLDSCEAQNPRAILAAIRGAVRAADSPRPPEPT